MKLTEQIVTFNLFIMIEDIIKSLIKKPLDEILTKIKGELKQIMFNRLIEYEVEEYNRNLKSKTILHREKPKDLYSFYVPLTLNSRAQSPLDDKTNIFSKNKVFFSKLEIFPTYKPGFKSKDDFKSIYELYLNLINPGNSYIRTNSIKKLFNKDQYITIIGDAGSGKSTLIKHLVINAIKEDYKIPIKIELRYLNNDSVSLKEYVFNKVFKQNELGFDDEIIERLLKSDKFVIFFDGYDELKLERKSIITAELNSFVRKFNKQNYIITSRPYAGIEQFPLFSNYYINDLSNSEIEEFIRKQLPSSEEEIAERIISSINEKKNESYSTFLRNPLLLSLFILTYQSYSRVPQKKSIFYSQVFDTLFTSHDSLSKMGFEREKSSGLSKEEIEEVLKIFSFLTFFNGEYSFSKLTFGSYLSKIKNTRKNLDFENTKLIADLQVALGIISLDGLDYNFPHRSLQEYFAALYISSLSRQNKKKFYLKILKNVPLQLNYPKSDYYSADEANLEIPSAEESYLSQNTLKTPINLLNFFTLLFELDYIDFLKYYLLELLKLVKEAYSTDDSKRKLGIINIYNEYLIPLYEGYHILPEFIDRKTAESINSLRMKLGYYPSIQSQTEKHIKISASKSQLKESENIDSKVQNIQFSIKILISSIDKQITKVQDSIIDHELGDNDILDFI